jgi:pilus assembly protein Flp/PilA
MELFKRLWNDEEGQGMVEYGLIIALVSIVVIAALVLVGDELVTVFNGIVTTLQGTP